MRNRNRIVMWESIESVDDEETKERISNIQIRIVDHKTGAAGIYPIDDNNKKSPASSTVAVTINNHAREANQGK